MVYKRHLDLNMDLNLEKTVHRGVSEFWVLSYVSAITPAHIDYIIEFL